jgi:3-oxoacyl-[acyl-carrier-protein] synthase-3
VTALEAVATYVPDRHVPIESLADQLGLTVMQMKLFRRFHGLDQIALDPDLSLLDLLLGATGKLDALRGREWQVRYVLLAGAFPVVVPYPHNPLHEMCRALGLERALAFTVTQQSCASGLLAIDIAGRLLAADSSDADGSEPLALVLAGGKAFTRDSRFLPETSIFGEGASACLVRRDGPRDRLLAYACNLRGEFDGEPAEVAPRFQKEYRPSLAEVMLRALDQAGLGIDEISLILPHNVNIVTWQRLCRRIGFPIERVVLDNVPVNGHVYCADAFINYQTARERDLLRPGDRYLVAAVGAGHGATFSAMVFEH